MGSGERAGRQASFKFVSRSRCLKGSRPKPTDYRQAQMQTKGTSKAAASIPLTAAQESANVAYSGSTAIPYGLGRPVMKLWFTFCPSRSAWPSVLPSLVQ